MSDGKKLLMTMTGEIHQPVRLYYEVYDKAKVLRAFSKLRCVELNRGKGRWIWLFQNETKKFKFATPYGKIPKHRRPLIIGSIRIPQDDVMWLDVRSHDRATKAVVFFNRHIAQSAAKVKHAAVVNQLFGVTTATLPSLDDMFDEAKIIERDPDEILRATEPLQAIPDAQERINKISAVVDQKSREPLPDIEKFPVHFYEEGITTFEASLKIRQIVAFEHWKGNTAYTLSEVIQSIIPGP